MSSKKCCVPECLNAYPTAPKGTTWHPFPKDKNLTKKWIEKIGENVEKRRKNFAVCSEHFNKSDFKTRNTHKESKFLSSSAVPSIFKKKNNKISAVNANAAVDISVLPLDVWENIFAYLSPNDVIALISACKCLKRTVQPLLNKFDLNSNYGLDINSLINCTLTTACTSINLNHCFWLKPKEIFKIIRKTNLKHLHIVECKVNRKCIKAISRDLRLTSLSITYNSDWRLFFRKYNENESIRGFRDLKSLELFYKKFPSNILIEIYAKVLVHCEELEHFKVFQCLSPSISLSYKYEAKNIYNQISSLSTFVPKLKSLVINLKNVYEDRNVYRLIALIMKDKVIPVKRADFGHQTGYLFKKQVLPNPKIILDKSTLAINGLNTDLNFWLNFPPVQNLISQADYKSVEIKNVEMNGFHQFAQKIALNSGKTLKEVRIKHRDYFYNYYSEFLDGLSHIALSCPQITVFDMTGHEFDHHQEFPYISNVMFRKHNALLNALVNLKNLEKLVIPPTILHCKYYESNGEKRNKAMPFWKVTSACKNLTEIRICDGYHAFDDLRHWVHKDSLNCIASCAKLKVVHLVCFQIESTGSSTHFDFSEIARSCRQLREVHIRGVENLSNSVYIFGNNIKIINISFFILCDKDSLDGLTCCPNLEKFYLDSMQIDVGVYNLFGDVLRKMKHLNAFVIRGSVSHEIANTRNRKRTELKKSRSERLDRLLKSIANEKPAFFYSLKGLNDVIGNRIPSAHLDAFYHCGLNDY